MDLTKTFMHRMGTAPEDIDVNAVLGEPETVGDTTVVPVTEMMIGFGIGAGPACCAGEDQGCCGQGSGGGGHAYTRPVATIEVGPEETRVHPIIDSQRITVAAILLSGWVLGWISLVLKTVLDRDA